MRGEKDGMVEGVLCPGEDVARLAVTVECGSGGMADGYPDGGGLDLELVEDAPGTDAVISVVLRSFRVSPELSLPADCS